MQGSKVAHIYRYHFLNYFESSVHKFSGKRYINCKHYNIIKIGTLSIFHFDIFRVQNFKKATWSRIAHFITATIETEGITVVAAKSAQVKTTVASLAVEQP